MDLRPFVIGLSLAASGSVSAQQAPPSAAAEAADRFSLDLPPADTDDAVQAEPAPQPSTTATQDAREAPSELLAPAPEPPAIAAEPAAAEPREASFSLDTPIAKLIADYRAKAVLDREMPGLSTDRNLDKFRSMSLRQLQPASGGRVTDALLERVGTALAAIR